MEPEKRWPRPIDDAARVAALHELGVLDRPTDADLEAVTRVASYVCGTPMAVVNLIDKERQWQAAATGTEPGEVTRDESMCAWSILSRGVTYTPDASKDRVFKRNPFVTGVLGDVRLYASAPVVLDTGHVVGTLCTFDSTPGELSRDQIDRLEDLATAAARILELRRSVGTLARAATTDGLTRVRNRAFFTETMRRALDLWTEGVSRPGMLYVDLNGFKPVNDRYGHEAGDTVLCAVAERLLENVRTTDVVARLGGDEFAVLVEAASDRQLDTHLRQVASRLAEALTESIALEDGTEVVVGASVGMAVAEHVDDTPESLIRRADAEMYAAKALTRGQGPGAR